LVVTPVPPVGDGAAVPPVLGDAVPPRAADPEAGGVVVPVPAAPLGAAGVPGPVAGASPPHAIAVSSTLAAAVSRVRLELVARVKPLNQGAYVDIPQFLLADIVLRKSTMRWQE
jgi:hypothetical protein